MKYQSIILTVRVSTSEDQMCNTQLIIEKSTNSKMEGSVVQVQSRESHSTKMHPYGFRVAAIAEQCDNLKPNMFWKHKKHKVSCRDS